MPLNCEAPAVLFPLASRPTRTILFCAVKVPPLKDIPYNIDPALVEELARLCTRLRAMRFGPLVVLPA